MELRKLRTLLAAVTGRQLPFTAATTLTLEDWLVKESALNRYALVCTLCYSDSEVAGMTSLKV